MNRAQKHFRSEWSASRAGVLLACPKLGQSTVDCSDCSCLKHTLASNAKVRARRKDLEIAAGNFLAAAGHQCSRPPSGTSVWEGFGFHPAPQRQVPETLPGACRFRTVAPTTHHGARTDPADLQNQVRGQEHSHMSRAFVAQGTLTWSQTSNSPHATVPGHLARC